MGVGATLGVKTAFTPGVIRDKLACVHLWLFVEEKWAPVSIAWESYIKCFNRNLLMINSKFMASGC